MANSGPDTGGSQFFLCFVPTVGLDGPPAPSHHTVFGRVVEGFDQLAKINAAVADWDLAVTTRYRGKAHGAWRGADGQALCPPAGGSSTFFVFSV